jgi:hypothetical protein
MTPNPQTVEEWRMKEAESIRLLKKVLMEAKFDESHVVFMPAVPFVGTQHEFVIEEVYGMKVARLISPPTE